MCRYEVPVVQWLLCGHARSYPPVKKHASYPGAPNPPSPDSPSGGECKECSEGLLSQYYARPVYVEALCADCAWAAYAYHPFYAVPPEVYAAVAASPNGHHVQTAQASPDISTNDEAGSVPTEPQLQDVPSRPPSPPLESTCASRSPLAMGSQSHVNGPAPAGVSAPTYADCLKMPKPQGQLTIGGSTTSTKSPSGRRGHGGSAPSHSGAKRKDNPKEKSTKKFKDSEAARGTSSSDTNTNRCVQPGGLPKRTMSKKEKRGPVQPVPALLPGTARARSNVKAQIRRSRSSRWSRGRPASRSASSTETVRPVRDA